MPSLISKITGDLAATAQLLPNLFYNALDHLQRAAHKTHRATNTARQQLGGWWGASAKTFIASHPNANRETIPALSNLAAKGRPLNSNTVMTYFDRCILPHTPPHTVKVDHSFHIMAPEDFDDFTTRMSHLLRRTFTSKDFKHTQYLAIPLTTPPPVPEFSWLPTILSRALQALLKKFLVGHIVQVLVSFDHKNKRAHVEFFDPKGRPASDIENAIDRDGHTLGDILRSMGGDIKARGYTPDFIEYSTPHQLDTHNCGSFGLWFQQKRIVENKQPIDIERQPRLDRRIEAIRRAQAERLAAAAPPPPPRSASLAPNNPPPPYALLPESSDDWVEVPPPPPIADDWSLIGNEAPSSPSAAGNDAASWEVVESPNPPPAPSPAPSAAVKDEWVFVESPNPLPSPSSPATTAVGNAEDDWHVVGAPDESASLGESFVHVAADNPLATSQIDRDWIEF